MRLTLTERTLIIWALGFGVLQFPSRGTDEGSADRITIDHVSYEYPDALPILLKRLGGSNQTRVESIKLLQFFGEGLRGTPAIEILSELFDRKVDFSFLDKLMSSPPTEELNGAAGDKLQELKELWEVKLQALTALVMSGSDEGRRRLYALEKSPSKAERKVAAIVRAEHEQYGTWKQGKVPTKEQEFKYLFGHQMLNKREFRAAVSRALESKQLSDLLKVAGALRTGGCVPLLDDNDGLTLLKSFLEASSEPSLKRDDLLDERRGAIRNTLAFIESIPKERQLTLTPFIEAVADDFDQYSSENATRLLQALRQADKK
jgi:hypothetical protein